MGDFRKLEMRAVLIPAILAIVAGAPPIASAEEDDNVIESFKVHSDGSGLLIPVQIGEKTYQFILDTGATLCVFDPKLQPDLVLTNRVTEVGTLGVIPIWRCRTGFVGRTRIPLNSRGCCIELDRFRKLFDDNIWGILGMDLLRRHVVQIDFDAGRVSILKSSDSISGEQIEMRFNDGQCPTIEVELPIVGRTEFMIDTGSCGYAAGHIAGPTFDTLVRTGKIFAFPGTTGLATIDENIQETSGILSEHVVGSFRHKDQIFGSGGHSYLGIGYFARFIATFDFPKGRLILEKGKRYAHHAPVNGLGVDIILNDDIPEIRKLDSDGLASRLGIKAGDRIVAIDGKDTRKMSLPLIGYYVHSVPKGVVFRISDESQMNERDVPIDN